MIANSGARVTYRRMLCILVVKLGSSEGHQLAS